MSFIDEMQGGEVKCPQFMTLGIEQQNQDSGKVKVPQRREEMLHSRSWQMFPENDQTVNIPGFHFWHLLKSFLEKENIHELCAKSFLLTNSKVSICITFMLQHTIRVSFSIHLEM